MKDGHHFVWNEHNLKICPAICNYYFKRTNFSFVSSKGNKYISVIVVVQLVKRKKGENIKLVHFVGNILG